MKKIIFIPLLMLVNLMHAQRVIPDGSLTDLNNQKSTLYNVIKNNQMTVVSFWATWCGPCKIELDAYKAHYPNWKNKYKAAFLAISVDNARAWPQVKNMVTAKGWPYSIFWDSEGGLMTKLNIQSIPQTYILNQKGQIVAEFTGYSPGAEQKIEAKLMSLAGK